MTKKASAFLRSLFSRLEAIGHAPAPWSKGRWGYCTHCLTCGAVVTCCVSDERVREFPDDTCAERLRSVEAC